MFEWVVNKPLFIDGYYLHGITSLYVHVFVPEFSKSFFISNSKLPFLSGLRVSLWNGYLLHNSYYKLRLKRKIISFIFPVKVK